MNDLCQRLSKWKERNGWSANQIALGIKIAYGRSYGHATIIAFLRGTPANSDMSALLSRFIERFVAPGDFNNWRLRFVTASERKDLTSEEAIAERREAVQKAREERRRKLLANERRPWRKASNDDEFHLDAATIRALSGGTMRSIGHA